MPITTGPLGAARRLAVRVYELRLPPLARTVRRKKLTYLNVPSFLSLDNAVQQVKARNVPGAFVEFGIALGGSAIYLASHSDGREFHGFDVFAMIPPPSERDDQKSINRYNDIAAGKSSGIGGDKYYGYVDDLYSQVTREFDTFGYPVDGKKIQLHRGLFEDTIDILKDTPIALAHIDCDWYDPVKLCLEKTAARLSVNGYMILDDYNHYDGSRRATDEFLAANPNFSMVHSNSNAVIIRNS